MSGVSQGIISQFETGERYPDERRKRALAIALNTPEELLWTPCPGGLVLHTLQRSLPAMSVNLLRAQLELAVVHVGKIVPGRRRWSPAAFTGRTPGAPSEWARWLRDQWDVPAGPVHSVVEILEDHDIVCLRRPLATVKTAAIGFWADHPIVFVANEATELEQRFALAHELGHAVMHATRSPHTEHAADEFAYEYLLPADDIRRELSRVSATGLLDLEREWGVPAGRLARRAEHLRSISPAARRRLTSILATTDLDVVQRPKTEQPTRIATTIRDRIRAGESHSAIAATALLDSAALRVSFLSGSEARVRERPAS